MPRKTLANTRRKRKSKPAAPRIALKPTRYTAVVKGRRRSWTREARVSSIRRCPKYAISAPTAKRQRSLGCYVRLMGRTRKYGSVRRAAGAKKARLNVLRMYRKNRDKPGCRRLTQDMRFLDREFLGGKTSAMC